VFFRINRIGTLVATNMFVFIIYLVYQTNVRHHNVPYLVTLHGVADPHISRRPYRLHNSPAPHPTYVVYGIFLVGAFIRIYTFESLFSSPFIPLSRSSPSNMETTLPLPFLASVNLGKGKSNQGLTRTQLSYLGCVHLTANKEIIDTLLQFLKAHVEIEAYIDVTAIDSVEDIISILDAGARKVFVAIGQLRALTVYADRVLPVISSQDEIPSDDIVSNGILYSIGNAESASNSYLQTLKSRKVSPIFLLAPTAAVDTIVKAGREFSAISIIPATRLTTDKASTEHISIATIIGALWSSDRADGLIPTVVTDERGISLGLVYSSEESVAESLKTGTGVYQSRKRGLWYKGATSGDTQELVRISLDCDQDCLKFVVRQKGEGMHGVLEV
jgi:phosphoribosyl-ATP pyrophosphohydrolase / phosphoribosyl-AMP cyclohydrolase / histidinol dehydrogenase